ncbi:glycoside hydrolase [Phlegmacium glaucopus]|nr:glycoside hydrolase [Phlegmacium glaucopus]
MFFTPAVVSNVLILQAAAFDNSRFDILSTHPSLPNSGLIPFSIWVKLPTEQLIPVILPTSSNLFLSFLNVSFGTGGAPSIFRTQVFRGTILPNCSSLVPDIITYRAKGKIVTMSLGGASGSVGSQSSAQATTFAQTIWDMFLDGSSSTRPFGNAVFDGVDFDIEGGSSAFYDVLVNSIRSLSAGTFKHVLNAADFDAVCVDWEGQHFESRFYNNVCGLQAFSNPSGQLGTYNESQQKCESVHRNLRLQLGCRISYITVKNLSHIATKMRQSFLSFSSVMLWDASQAHANNRYDLTIKKALVAAGGTGFDFPACSAAAFVSGSTYAGGSQVAFRVKQSDLYIWQAKWFASSQPSSNPNGDWNAILISGRLIFGRREILQEVKSGYLVFLLLSRTLATGPTSGRAPSSQPQPRKVVISNEAQPTPAQKSTHLNFLVLALDIHV